MGQARAMKIGLEARLKWKVESDWKIMEWITELAGELLSRGQVGKGCPNSVLQVVRQEKRQGCLGDERAGDGQTLEGSQTPKQMNTSLSLVKGELRSASELFLQDQQVTDGMWMR